MSTIIDSISGSVVQFLNVFVLNFEVSEDFQVLSFQLYQGHVGTVAGLSTRLQFLKSHPSVAVIHVESFQDFL